MNLILGLPPLDWILLLMTSLSFLLTLACFCCFHNLAIRLHIISKRSKIPTPLIIQMGERKEYKVALVSLATHTSGGKDRIVTPPVAITAAICPHGRKRANTTIAIWMYLEYPLVSNLLAWKGNLIPPKRIMI